MTNPLQFIRSQASAFRSELLNSIANVVAAQLQEFERQARGRPRTAGVFLIGEGLFPGAPRRREADPLDVLDSDEWARSPRRAPAVPDVRKPFASGASFSLVPDEQHAITFSPMMPIGPGASLIAWGSCVLVDACVGTESVTLWPGSCPVMLTTRACLPGMQIRVIVRGAAL